jgi:hypothetical protein
LWNLRHRLNKKLQFPINLISKDEIEKIYRFKDFFKVKIIAIQRIKIKFDKKKKLKNNEIVNKNQFKKLSKMQQKIRTKFEK